MEDKDKFEEILQRLTKIETKLDDFGNLRNKSEAAYSVSKENVKDIADVKNDVKDINKKMEKITYVIIAYLIAIIGFFIKITFFH